MKAKIVKTGIEFISDERKRQIEVEGYDEEHDDRHYDNELAIAASCYCLPSGQREIRAREHNISFS